MPHVVRFSRKVRGLPRSQRDYSIENVCLSKIRHRSWADAENKIQQHIAENIETGRIHRSNGLTAYRCKHCGYWHIGHSRGPILHQQYERSA